MLRLHHRDFVVVGPRFCRLRRLRLKTLLLFVRPPHRLLLLLLLPRFGVGSGLLRSESAEAAVVEEGAAGLADLQLEGCLCYSLPRRQKLIDQVTSQSLYGAAAVLLLRMPLRALQHCVFEISRSVPKVAITSVVLRRVLYTSTSRTKRERPPLCSGVHTVPAFDVCVTHGVGWRRESLIPCPLKYCFLVCVRYLADCFVRGLNYLSQRTSNTAVHERARVNPSSRPQREKVEQHLQVLEL